MLVLVTAPDSPIVELVDLKKHLRVEHDEENDLILALEKAAVQHIDGRDGWLGRCVAQQSWELRLADFPACGSIRLPLPPLVSVESVQYYDSNNALQTLATTVYEVAGARGANPGAVVLKDGQSWPVTYDKSEAVLINFTAGFAVNNSPADGDIPAPIVIAIKLLVGHWYANREPVAAGNFKELPFTVDALLAPYRVHYFA